MHLEQFKFLVILLAFVRVVLAEFLRGLLYAEESKGW